MAKLGEVCLINPKSCTLRDDTEVSFIPMTKVGEHGEFDASEIKNYSEVKKGFTNFQNGDILFAKITPCMENGKGAIAHNMKNGIGFGSTEFHVLRPDTDKITSEWLYYLTTWKTFRKEAERNMTGSAGQKRVPKTFLENYVVNLPDIDTQKSENKILRKVDDLIFLRKQQLAKLDELAKARFVEMFGTFPANPFRWSIGKIQDVVSDVRYGSSRPAVEGGKYPYLRMNNITYSGELDLRDTKRIDIPDSELDKCTVRRGDVLFNRTNSKELVGKTCVYNRDELMVLAGFVIRVRINERIRPEVLSAFLNMDFSKRMLIGMCKTAIGQANINAKELQNIDLYIPPIELQDQFVTLKNKIDQQKQTVQQSLEKLELLKQAPLQESFGYLPQSPDGDSPLTEGALTWPQGKSLPL